AAPAIAAADAASRMSPTTNSHPIEPAAEASTSSVRPAITTRAPQATSSPAAWRPRLVPPPVTSAVRPSNSPSRNIVDAGMSAGAYGAYDLGVPHARHPRRAARLARRAALRRPGA